MPSTRPAYYTGGLYHMYNRGVHRLPIFREAHNYLFALRRLKHYCPSLELAPIAYRLLPNHCHLLVRQDGDHPARLLPQGVFNSYSKAYNERYGHSGTLFQGCFRDALVDAEGYLVQLCCYIRANPVIHGLVTGPELWPYSNYLEWSGKRGGTLVDPLLVRAYFPLLRATLSVSGSTSITAGCRMPSARTSVVSRGRSLPMATVHASTAAQADTRGQTHGSAPTGGG